MRMLWRRPGRARWYRSGRRRRRRLWIAAGLLGATAASGWIGARSWAPHHLRQVTGRDDVSGIGCLYCHRPVSSPTTRAQSGNARYVSPTSLVVAPDGGALYVVASGTEQLLKVDLGRGSVVGSVLISGNPHSVAISADGRRIAVSSRDADTVTLIDTANLAVVATIAAGADPLGLALSADGAQIWIANGGSDDVSVVQVNAPGRTVRLTAGNEPYAVALGANGNLVVVANRLARPTLPAQVPVSELTLIDAATGRVIERRELVSAHLSEGVALSADGRFALATAVRVRNLLPITQVARGGVMNSAIVYLETAPGGRTVQLPLDEPNAYFADPAAIVMTPDDALAFIAHGGARTVTAVDIAALRALVEGADDAELALLADDLGVTARYVIGRIATRHNPIALAVSPDGSRLYVAERLADSIAVVDIRELRVIDRIQLQEPTELTAARRGEIVFHDASVTFQGQFSCRSCHPDGHTDGLIWDFVIDGVGDNLVETRSLRGIRDTAPFKWNGKNPDLATQCGPRFALVLTRSDPFTPEQLADLVTFIESIPRQPQRAIARLAGARERGRVIFFRDTDAHAIEIPVANRCSTCHRPPLFTDRLMTDVGTGGRFDTPHLFAVNTSPPYLHDGRARTLEQIWTVHSRNDEHGATSDLTKIQLNDLIVYLRSL